MEEYKIYLAGEWVTTDQPHEIINPYSREKFAKTYLASQDQLKELIGQAENSERDMAALPSYKKYDILRYISDALDKDKERLAHILAQENGKPIRYALGEIKRATQTFLTAAEEAKRLPKEYISLDWSDRGKNKEGLVKWFPLGLVGGITPFNFPMNLVAHKVAPAIAAGCPVIIKPASTTPLSALELAKIIDQTDLPKGAFSVIPLKGSDSTPLVEDERVKVLSFTGSQNVGWDLKQKAGKKMVVLELGGNAGMIICKDCDLDKAIGQSVVGGFAFSGQTCISIQRIYVEQNIFNEFTEKYIEKIKKLKKGDPADQDTEISVVIDQENADRIEKWVEEAKAAGATVLCGGKKDDAYYEPTVLTNTRKGMKVQKEEIFGPVVTLEPFTHFEDAVDLVNDSDYGLQAGVFTENIGKMNYAYNELKVGGVIINAAPIFRMDHMPYGGSKDSGFGREGLKYAIREMMESRLLVKDIV